MRSVCEMLVGQSASEVIVQCSEINPNEVAVVSEAAAEF